MSGASRDPARMKRLLTMQKQMLDLALGRLAQAQACAAEQRHDQERLLSLLGRDGGVADVFPQLVLQRLQQARLKTQQADAEARAREQALQQAAQRAKRTEIIAERAAQEAERDEATQAMQEVLECAVARAPVSAP
jgi:hypothetical protein